MGKLLKKRKPELIIMKILFLCNKSPFPPKEGGPMAMNAIINGLAIAGHDVKVLALNTNKYFTKPEDIPDSYKKTTDIEFVYADLSIKPLHALKNLFSPKSYHVERFETKAIKNKIIEILKADEFDIVQLELLYMTPYIPVIKEYSKAKIILRSHNIEHLIWERLTGQTKNPLKKLYLSQLTRKLKNYELSVLNEYDGIATISNKDADFFRKNGCNIPLTHIPFGVDISDYVIEKTDMEFPSIFHLGAMNWPPNEEGIKWFLDEVWMKTHERFPQLKFYLAGRMMPQWLLDLKMPNVEVLGEIDDARNFILSKAIMVVPLFSGSGIRIKIIEGMALGKTIISTNIGAEGLNYTNRKDILIADTADEFVNAVEKTIENQKFCENMGNKARLLIETHHNNKTIIQKLVGFYNSILKN
ncbi:MAG: glycosyl transferase family 4 [Bacteroidetes bacterium]|nr:MAG: glycosyl transferase family 4 [Bacteroidota bacterium]